MRIVENVSKQGWIRWLERLTTIINENGLNTADPQSVELIEKHMNGFFFGEGDYGQFAAGFPRRRKVAPAGAALALYRDAQIGIYGNHQNNRHCTGPLPPMKAR